MKLIFIDEIKDSKFKDYFGICAGITDLNHYKNIKSEFHNILRKSNWDETIEFKGSYIFSSKRGDEGVKLEERIKIAEDLININVAKKHARISFCYARQKNVKNEKKVYLETVAAFLQKILPKAQKGLGKDVLMLNCDYRNDIKPEEIQKITEPIINRKGYVLLEKVNVTHSGFDTVGLLITDIVGYLIGRVDVISNDAEFFENTPETEIHKTGKYKHLISSRTLLKAVKNIKVYEMRKKRGNR